MNLYLNDIQLEFKIDTGAEVTVIPELVATPFQSLLRTFSQGIQGPVKPLYKFVDSLQKHCEKTLVL